jgi:DNA invertase Pin-like site-specific DNA recombinase
VLETLRTGYVLVIWKLDRLGRSLKHLLAIVTDLMTGQVGVKSLNDPIITTTPQRQLIFHLFASLAEFGREVMRERTMRRFKYAGHVQRFLSAHAPILSHFRPLRRRLRVQDYRQEMAYRWHIWREITVTEAAA